MFFNHLANRSNSISQLCVREFLFYFHSAKYDVVINGISTLHEYSNRGIKVT